MVPGNRDYGSADGLVPRVVAPSVRFTMLRAPGASVFGGGATDSRIRNSVFNTIFRTGLFFSFTRSSASWAAVAPSWYGDWYTDANCGVVISVRSRPSNPMIEISSGQC